MSVPVVVGPVEEIRRLGRKVVRVGRSTVLVVHEDGAWYGIDNRCPHMGFPLHRGDLKDGLLSCHWHHARFDVSCGAALDPWADDAETWPVFVQEGVVYIDPVRPVRDPERHGMERLRRSLDERLRLVSAKAVLELQECAAPLEGVLKEIALFGAREVEGGWQPGLSILASVANVFPLLGHTDRPRGLVHAAARVAADAADESPRRPLPPLRGSLRRKEGLRRWFRDCIEVRDGQGAERILGSLVAAEGAAAALDAVVMACTDHRYLDGGHSLDYAVKCAELVEHIDVPSTGEEAALLFTSLVPALTGAARMEETSAWRSPVDVAALVDTYAARISAEAFTRSRAPGEHVLPDEDAVVDILLGDDPEEALDVLTGRLAGGAPPQALADAVVSAAILRVLRFGTANEDGDWDTVHHTLTYANAVAEAMRRVPSPELFRGVLDGAVSVFLDRFLNVPPAPLPDDRALPAGERPRDPTDLLLDLLLLYDGRAAVEESTGKAAEFLAAGGEPGRLLTTLGTAVLREDAGFHEFQSLDIAWRRLERRGPGRSTGRALMATTRWIASRYPTRRAADQTFEIARRLHRGDSVYETA